MKSSRIILAMWLVPGLLMAQDTTRTRRVVQDSLRARKEARITTFRPNNTWRIDTAIIARPEARRFAFDTASWRIDSGFIARERPAHTYAFIQGDSARPRTGRGRASGTVGAITTEAGATFADNLFPPELVMQNQARLRLTDAQRDLIIQEVNRLQGTATMVQWKVAEEQEKLSDLLARDAIEEAAALQQVDKMIGYETAVKRAQLTMLIRIRNALTPAQRTMLQEVRRRE
jgi:Spy/CpxP family protein refolding chaperone